MDLEPRLCIAKSNTIRDVMTYNRCVHSAAMIEVGDRMNYIT
jgi:hypothetical protein